MGRVVISHTLDQTNPKAPIYRVVYGLELKELTPLLDDKGEPVLRDDGTSELEETIVGYDEVHEVVFDGLDDRWFISGAKRRSRRPADEVVAEQRQLIRDAFDQQARDAEHQEQARASATKELPGAGEAL